MGCSLVAPADRSQDGDAMAADLLAERPTSPGATEGVGDTAPQKRQGGRLAVECRRRASDCGNFAAPGARTAVRVCCDAGRVAP